jgi:hypothetical protein
LHDSPPKSTAEEDDEMSKLPPAQKKKLKQKQRKAEARAKKVIIISVAYMELVAAEVFMVLIYFLFRRQKRKMKNQVLVGYQSLGNDIQNLLIQILGGKSCYRLNFSTYCPLTLLYLHSISDMETCFKFHDYTKSNFPL